MAFKLGVLSSCLFFFFFFFFFTVSREPGQTNGQITRLGRVLGWL